MSYDHFKRMVQCCKNKLKGLVCPCHHYRFRCSCKDSCSSIAKILNM